MDMAKLQEYEYCWKLHDEAVHFPVSRNEGLFSFLAGLGVAVLHAPNKFFVCGFCLLVHVFEYFFVVDLSGGGFLSAGVVTNLEVSNFIPAPVDVRDDVPFVFLHMVDVEQDFAGGTINRLADHIRLVRVAKKQVRRVAERLQHHY